MNLKNPNRGSGIYVSLLNLYYYFYVSLLNLYYYFYVSFINLIIVIAFVYASASETYHLVIF